LQRIRIGILDGDREVGVHVISPIEREVCIDGAAAGDSERFLQHAHLSGSSDADDSGRESD
jgi:hypothetical protein